VDARPAGEPLAQGFRAVIRETLGGLYQRDPDRLLRRVRLMATVPEVRARFFEEQANGVEELARLLGHRPGASELRLRVVGSALLAPVSVALELWQRDDGTTDLLVLLDKATDALTESMIELSPSSRGRDA
jgi:hypothetical protein